MYQSTQLMGRFSRPAGSIDHVENVPQSSAWVQAVSVSSWVDVHAGFQPVSNEPGLLLSASPLPPFRCVWMPEPGAGRHPFVQPSTNCRKRATVTSYVSSVKSVMV